MRRLLATCSICLTLLVVSPVSADVFRFWVGGHGDYFSGSGDMFTEFDNKFGGGLDLGVEFFNITLGVESLIMGESQYLIDFNLGIDFFFGESPRFGVGVYTGPMLFFFPDREVETGVDFSVLGSDEQQSLLSATGFTGLDQVESQFDQYTQEEEDLGKLAFGWNLGRVRLSLDFPVGPLYIGVAGALGYHLLISGEDVAAGAKNRAIDEFTAQYGLPTELTDAIRDVVGAEPVDEDNLNGLNWDTNLYIRFEM